MLNKKALAIKLSKLELPASKEVNLEQYETEGDDAAEILLFAFMNGDIEGKKIADLGCGNGIFGVGALLLGAKKVYFVDVDREMIKLAKKNSSEGVFVNKDVLEFNEKVDTVIMNPPFGVQERKADKAFLEKAMEISDSIYSIHKIESKVFIDKLCKENSFIVKEIKPFKFLLKKTYDFHKKEKYYVDVGCWHIVKK